MIRVQDRAFDAAAELKAFQAVNRSSGATVMFIGTVRELSEGARIDRMTLEHYPGMTEKALAGIEAEARKRWPLEASLVIHRYGPLEPGDDIVLVLTASSHRQAAFEACEFLMDWLKTMAPFWKLEETAGETRWVDAKDKDDQAARRWDKP
ncbi:molybdenum cofactor biosynthesis protein MoaE [Nordella sp. HKS 07]|uniref:molybdenum cofactor biosynthesis protein MoaE n=1 Tax=Nordella sp. HKS 07 TaxID=2712222 RepID=UPI0013E15A99|nr:molybdenum cofactor biosynthesis protein MoaE [Nordella sp. HKS 07]QIG52121.1 molybdenum cofactor biosynthesis protein MoaE [Nordella sp. HKS 07]